MVGIFCIAKLALHLIADSNSGFQGDELLHIETGNHLAIGYMEFPPLIGVVAFLQNLLQSDSVFVHHLFAHLSAILVLIFLAKIIIELGGNTKGVFLALACVIIAPAFGRSQQLFQPVVFSQLVWLINFYLLTKYVKHLEKRFLWYLTFTTAVALLTKYDAVFSIFGLFALLLFRHTRQALIQHQFWWNALVFIIVISPNILWQYSNDFPVLNMFARLYEKQLDHLNATQVMSGLIVALNPITLLIYVPALVFMFHHSLKQYRILSVSILLSVLFLSVSRGKSYYFYPITLTILPFGGLVWGSMIVEKRKWLMYPVSLLLVSGVFLIPFGLPVFPLENYLKNDYPYEKKEIPGGQRAIRFEERYSKEKWSATIRAIKSAYETLPEDEKHSALIWGKHYGQAGAVNLFREKHHLPAAFSLHGSFYTWLPKGEMPVVTIGLAYNVSDFFQDYFNEVTKIKTIYNPYSDNEEELYQHIYICRKPKQTFDELKAQFKDRIFE